MKKTSTMMAVIVFLTGMLCIGALLIFNRATYRLIVSTEKDLDRVMERVDMKHEEMTAARDNFDQAIQRTRTNIKRLKQKALISSQTPQPEHAEAVPEEPAGESVFDKNESTGSVFTSEAAHIVALDPGHQSERVDMSALEPNGPGSSEMKAKCSTGTQGVYTRIPEYQLNLDVSLKLKTELEERGYQVVMTRTDNDTAISNMERAKLAAEKGAEIYVRIHANGTDSSSASGALALSPSENNPYIPQLYEASKQLSWDILDSYCAVTGFETWGVQYADNMTGINWSTIPVTILEMGFMTNENDDRKMNDPSFQDVMVNGIADGIDLYFNDSETSSKKEQQS